jgi:hypothetical protein
MFIHGKRSEAIAIMCQPNMGLLSTKTAGLQTGADFLSDSSREDFNSVRIWLAEFGLSFHQTSFNLQSMSNRALAVIQEFNSLPQVEQLAVYEAIARKVTPADYGPLSDQELTAIAAESFALLDQEESRAQSR